MRRKKFRIPLKKIAETLPEFDEFGFIPFSGEHCIMKVIDLLALLSQMPSEADVVVKGYEGGVDDVCKCEFGEN
jgi:hypothetical protein